MIIHNNYLCLLVLGNKDRDGSFKSKIKWVIQSIENAEIITNQSNRLFFQKCNYFFELYFAYGTDDCIQLFNSFLNNKKVIIATGSCCSLDKTINIGDIFIPYCSFDLKKNMILHNTNMINHAKKESLLIHEKVKIGKIIQVKNIIEKLTTELTEMVDSNICLDLETAIIARLCRKNNIDFCAIHCVSDNLSLNQNLKYVKNNINLNTKKMNTKKKTINISITTLKEILRWKLRLQK